MTEPLNPVHSIGELLDEFFEDLLADDPKYQIGKLVGDRRGYARAMAETREVTRLPPRRMGTL